MGSQSCQGGWIWSGGHLKRSVVYFSEGGTQTFSQKRERFFFKSFVTFLSAKVFA
jgi:hypothetical protein